MSNLINLYDRLVAWASGRFAESIALLITRIALAHVFWASGRTKVEDGSFLTVSDTTTFLFENDYSGVPVLPPDVAAHLALYSETLFPILLVLGLGTRFAALALFGMTMVIQTFVYPEAWWSVHILWVAMAAILMSRGAGLFSLDSAVTGWRQR